MDFEQWMKEVDDCLVDELGLSSTDLPDWSYYDNWEGEMSPNDAAKEVIRHSFYS